MSDSIIKKCSCGRTYTKAQWEALPPKGIQTYEWMEVHDVRNCVCHSTMTLVLDEGEPEPEKGDRWYNRITDRRIVVREVHTGNPPIVEYQDGKRPNETGSLPYGEFFARFTKKTPCRCGPTLRAIGLHAPGCAYFVHPKKKSA